MISSQKGLLFGKKKFYENAELHWLHLRINDVGKKSDTHSI